MPSYPWQQPDANPSTATLTAAAITQLGGYVQGSISITIQNTDDAVPIRVLVWMGANPPELSDVQSGILLQPGGSTTSTVTVGGTGIAARNVRPRLYGCSIGSDQSGANTVVSETRT